MVGSQHQPRSHDSDGSQLSVLTLVLATSDSTPTHLPTACGSKSTLSFSLRSAGTPLGFARQQSCISGDGAAAASGSRLAYDGDTT